MKPDWQDKTTAGLIKWTVLINPASSHSNDVFFLFFVFFSKGIIFLQVRML